MEPQAWDPTIEPRPVREARGFVTCLRLSLLSSFRRGRRRRSQQIFLLPLTQLNEDHFQEAARTDLAGHRHCSQRLDPFLQKGARTARDGPQRLGGGRSRTRELSPIQAAHEATSKKKAMKKVRGRRNSISVEAPAEPRPASGLARPLGRDPQLLPPPALRARRCPRRERGPCAPRGLAAAGDGRDPAEDGRESSGHR
ncbi:unnamed protein product [Durusdinium trenchii]|uniref:Uncharacterized protein n=1 Tax=Durusdinium trenchii TaxID=1381693 RepID=A0ABP0M3F3_9DINO